ncbi:hypothetical protein Tco_1186512, partial [Tanacetum coccineum]
IYFLAWMGWNADIEGRGLGELCTIGNTGAYPPRVVRFYNYNSEGHIAKQCTAKKRAKDSEWFKDKILLAQLQATRNFKADHIDAYDSDCDNEATANAIFLKNLPPIGSFNDDTVKPSYNSDILSEVRSRGSDFDIPVVFSLIIALLRNKALKEASRLPCLALQTFNLGRSFLQSFELHLWPFDQAVDT